MISFAIRLQLEGRRKEGRNKEEDWEEEREGERERKEEEMKIGRGGRRKEEYIIISQRLSFSLHQPACSQWSERLGEGGR